MNSCRYGLDSIYHFMQMFNVYVPLSIAFSLTGLVSFFQFYSHLKVSLFYLPPVSNLKSHIQVSIYLLLHQALLLWRVLNSASLPTSYVSLTPVPSH